MRIDPSHKPLSMTRSAIFRHLVTVIGSFNSEAAFSIEKGRHPPRAERIEYPKRRCSQRRRQPLGSP